MKPILVVNPECGWDNVAHVFDAAAMTDEQYKKLEEICEELGYILIDWKNLDNVESFLSEYTQGE